MKVMRKRYETTKREECESEWALAYDFSVREVTPSSTSASGRSRRRSPRNFEMSLIGFYGVFSAWVL